MVIGSLKNTGVITVEMNIQVVRANKSHADIISSIGKQAFSDAFGYSFDSKKELQDYLDYTYEPAKVAKSICKENNVFFLVYVDDVPAGFVKLKKHSLNEQIESIAQMELQKIYVLSYFHGSGAAAALMNKVIDVARKLQPDYIWLDVHIENHKAIRFYEKNGFTQTGKYFFTIGTQTFEYNLMSLPVAIQEPLHYQTKNPVIWK